MKKTSALCIIFGVFHPILLAHAGTMLHHLEKLAASGQSMTLNQALATLPVEFDQFALSYASNSPMESNFKNPRIILGAERGSTWVAFAGHGDLINGNQIEVIETTSLNPDWGRLAFLADGKMRFEKRPQSCLNCHTINLDARFLAPIWDTYPDWIGVYGSAAYGSGLPIPEFEKAAYSQFLSHVPHNPRYHWLSEKFQLPDTPEALAEQNRDIGLVMAKRQFRNIFYIILSGLGVLPERKALNQAEIAQASEGYYQQKRARFLSLIAKFGTAKDQEHYQNGLAISPHEFHPFELRAFDLSAENIMETVRLDKLLAKFGLPPTLATLTKERRSMSNASGIISKPLDLILSEALADADSDSDYSGLNSISQNLCELLLQSTNRKP